MTQDLLDAYKAKSGKKTNNLGQGEDEDSDDAMIDEVMLHCDLSFHLVFCAFMCNIFGTVSLAKLSSILQLALNLHELITCLDTT
mgnify:FL=1